MELVAPFLSMIGLSFLLMPLTSIARFRAVTRGQVKPHQFKFMQLEGAPEFIVKTTRHWSNLYEVPVLFYVLILLCIQFHWIDRTIIFCAWGFVLARAAHMAIHLTYNQVVHRFLAFLVSILFLAAIFFRVIFLNC